MYRFAKFASNASFSMALALGLLLFYSSQSQALITLVCNWYRIVGTSFVFCTGECNFPYLSCGVINVYDNYGNYLRTLCTCLI